MLLCHLSAECLDVIAHYLDFYDIKALELAGSHSLNDKLARVTKIDAVIWSTEKWPFSAFNYPNLRQLSIQSESIEFFSPIHVDERGLMSPQGHNRLESLTIQAPHGLRFLCTPSLPSLLPQLKILNIVVFTDIWEPHYFGQLPGSLTSLTLSCERKSALSDTKTPLHYLNQLPQHLTTLIILKIAFERAESSRESISLPPSLHTLELNVLPLDSILNCLPTSLTSLQLHLPVSETSTIYVSKLPKKLEILRIKAVVSAHIRLCPDVELPYTLHTLEIMEAVRLEWQKGDPKFPTLESILTPSITRHRGIYPNNIFQPTEGVTLLQERLTVYGFASVGTHLAKIPILTHFDGISLHMSDQMISLLPDTLVSLSAGITGSEVWMKKLESLVKLKRLSLCTGSVLSTVGFWNIMYTSLESLEVGLDRFESLEALEGPWPFLKELKLQTSNADKLAPNIFDQLNARLSCSSAVSGAIKLPQSLEKLDLMFTSHGDYWTSDIPNLHILKRLRLATIKIIDRSLHPDDSMFEILFRLPASLRTLEVDSHTSFHPKFLWQLPRQLRSLTLRLGPTLKYQRLPSVGTPEWHAIQAKATSDDPSERMVIARPEVWTNEHLEKLPPFLTYLSVPTDSFAMFYSVPLADVLPKTLARCQIYPTKGSPTCKLSRL